MLFATAIWDTDKPLKKQKLEQDECMSEQRRRKVPAMFIAVATTPLYSPGSRIQLSIYLAFPCNGASRDKTGKECLVSVHFQ